MAGFMRLMALDVGEKTVGIAITDELGITASPRETFRRDGTELNRLVALAEQEGVGEVVVGLPISLNGTHGPAAQRSLQFAEWLRARTTIPVVTWDERLTTAEAEKMLIAASMRRGKRKQVIDQVAATLILQGYLTSKTFHRPGPGAADGEDD